MPAAQVGWADARAAVATMAGRIASLIRSVPDPDVPALGKWTAGQLAAHVTHVFEVDRDLLDEVASPLADLDDLAELTQSKVRDESACDPAALATRVEAAAAEFLATAATLGGTEPRFWMGGVKVTASVLACHIVNESVVHGLDLARATGQRWAVGRREAQLAFEGFICPMYRSLGRPAFAVDQVRAAGVRATYDVRVRGGGRWFLVFADGGHHRGAERSEGGLPPVGRPEGHHAPVLAPVGAGRTGPQGPGVPVGPPALAGVPPPRAAEAPVSGVAGPSGPL